MDRHDEDDEGTVVVVFQSRMHETNLAVQAKVDQLLLASAQDDTETAAECFLLYTGKMPN
jgi:hypothetical protein